jgi:hypothetical protein
MITAFKIFEDLNKPEIGDFIIADKLPIFQETKINNFLRDNIGNIYHIQNDIIAITYENIPEELIKYFGKINNIPTKSVHVDYTTYAKNLENLKIKIKAKKYNIL